MPSVYIKTYGCQMNERDSEAVAAQFLARGYTLASSEAEADVVLLNTCSVRDMAERKALGKMRAVAGQVRKRRRETVLGFLGCVAQGRGAELLELHPRVDMVVGTQKLHRVVDLVEEVRAGRRSRVVETDAEAGSESAIREHLPSGWAGMRRVTALVSIMQGCNQYCTFCIVPYTRGLERSRSIADIVAECRGLAERGVREVTLLGQIVTSYGRREIGVRSGRSAFVQLLDAVAEVDGLDRIRFTAPHPKGYGDDLVEAYGRLGKLCEHAHLPVQSGSDRMLGLMHRGYTRARFVGLVERLRGVNPAMGLTTDIIVGFPGETEEDFGQTCDLVREVGFDQVYLFKYSSRRGTPAAQMPGALAEEVIEERHARMLLLVNAEAARRSEACVGRRMQVLVEGPSRRNALRLEGRTRCNRIVVFEGSERHRGQLLDLDIVRAAPFTLYGDAVILKGD